MPCPRYLKTETVIAEAARELADYRWRPPQAIICKLAGSLRDHRFGLEIARTRHPSLEFLGTGGREDAAEPMRSPGINWGTDRVNSSEKFQSGKLPAYAISGCPDARARLPRPGRSRSPGRSE